MALRLGGRLELEGGEQALLLPADGASVQHEVDELRRELEQAKQLGEAYARELAEVFAAGVAAAVPADEVANAPELVGAARFDVLRGLGAALVRRMRPLLDGVQPELDQIRAKLGEGSDPVVNLAQRYAGLCEVLGELNRVATADPGEAVRIDPVQVVREVVAGAERRASRHGVRIALLPGECASFAIELPTLTLLLRSLLDHAIAATPRDGTVQVRVGPASPRGVEVTVRDEGPAVPPRAHDDLLLHRIDPTSIGRPAGVTLIVAHAAAAVLRASMSLGQSPGGGLEVRLVFPGADG
jgi:signal transduction histidine kinase